MIFKYTILLCLLPVLVGCTNNKASSGNSNVEKQTYQKKSPDFDADSAYYFVGKQVAFGPRIPNSQAHIECGDFLAAGLRKYGAKVIEQKVDLKAYDGTILHSRNIIGSYNTENPSRILLFAHWDTRPFSDQDANQKLHKTPVQGANDGASGVGVLLEVARVMQSELPSLGVDIIFFDAEDNGTPDFVTDVPEGNWWCLGSQYWSKNPHVPGYTARFGILLDMVGATGATFYKEEFSKSNALGIVNKIWNTARDLGYGRYFVDKDGGGVMDDHVPVSQNLNIPSVDIIHYDPNTPSKFGWYWHTSRDDMETIGKETLKAVGQTVLEVVYKEKQ